MHRLALAVLVLAACDAPDEEQVKQIVGAAVQDNLADLRDEQKSLKESHAALTTKLEALDASSKGQTAALDGALAKIAKLEERLHALETRPTTAEVAVAAPAHKVYKVVLGKAQTRGPEDAPITIVQYSDYECPHCARMIPTLDALQTKYGDDLRFAFKHFPLSFHTHARAAAIAAEAAAEQDKFWEMHAKLFDNTASIDDANIQTWAKEIGLDMKQFNKDLADADIAQRVDDMKAEGEALGIAGTPDFYVNGRHVIGGAFEEVIDEELPKARKLIADGVAPARVYERTIETGLPQLEDE